MLVRKQLLFTTIIATCMLCACAEEESNREEFYPICSDYTSFSVNEKGEKVGEFHEDKIKEILGLDNEDDNVNIITCSDKIAICGCYNSKVGEYGLYAVNEGLGKNTKLTEFSYQYCNVDYYKGNFYFSYDDKELILSIEDSLEYDVKEAGLGAIFDKIGNKIIRLGSYLSITRLLDEVGYIIASDSSVDGYVMIQKDGTVTELPLLDDLGYSLKDYDNTGFIFDDGDNFHYVKLDTMEEKRITVSGQVGEKIFCKMKNGKVYWDLFSENNKSSDISYMHVYYEHDLERNTNSVLVKTAVPPESKHGIAYNGGFCICGDNIFIVDVADDKTKWFRIEKEDSNASLVDMDLTIEIINSRTYGTVKYKRGTYYIYPVYRNNKKTFSIENYYKEYFVLSSKYSEHADDINTDIRELLTSSEKQEIELRPVNGAEDYSEIRVDNVDIKDGKYLSIDITDSYFPYDDTQSKVICYQLLYDLETGKRLFDKDLLGKDTVEID